MTTMTTKTLNDFGRTLEWHDINGDVEVAALKGERDESPVTWIMTRQREAGRPNRFMLTRVIDGIAVQLGIELPAPHCRKIAEEDALKCTLASTYIGKR